MWITVRSFEIDYGLGHQCGSIEITWRPPVAFETSPVFPLYLNLLPLNSTAIIQQITEWNQSMQTGSTTLGFNLTSGTRYMAAVTDSVGNGVGRASKMLMALSSTSSSTSCVGQGVSSPPSSIPFTVSAITGQTHPFLNIQWGSSIKQPPVRIFVPGQFPMNLVTSGSNSATAPIPCEQASANASRALVAFGDGKQFLTSPLTTVPGVCSPISVQQDMSTLFIGYP